VKFPVMIQHRTSKIKIYAPEFSPTIQDLILGASLKHGLF